MDQQDSGGEQVSQKKGRIVSRAEQIKKAAAMLKAYNLECDKKSQSKAAFAFLKARRAKALGLSEPLDAIQEKSEESNERALVKAVNDSRLTIGISNEMISEISLNESNEVAPQYVQAKIKRTIN